MTVTVYMAGKITANGWRHSIVPGLRDVHWQGGDKHADMPEIEAWSVPEWDDWRYGGPYFIADDHRCYHGDGSHGVGADGEYGGDKLLLPTYDAGQRNWIVAQCRYWIARADVVFVWLDDRTAFGTLVEIGYAAALDKPIYLYQPDCCDLGRLAADLEALSRLAGASRNGDRFYAARAAVQDVLREHDDFWFAQHVATEAHRACTAQDAWQHFAAAYRR